MDLASRTRVSSQAKASSDLVIIYQRRLLGLLVAVSALLAFAHLVGRYLQHQIATPSRVLQAWLDFLSLDQEAALGAWYSTVLWLLAAALALLLRRQHRSAWQWTALAGLFLLLSLDEGASLHERIGFFLEENIQLGGIFTYAWIFYGFALLAVAGAVFGRFLLTLPRRALITFAVAAGVYVSGAIGFEMYVADVTSGEIEFLPWLGWSVSVMFEEILEMLGIIIAIGGLLDLLREGDPITVAVR